MTNPQNPASRGEGRKLLIVDDDEAVLKGLSAYFEQLGYQTLKAATGRSGIESFNTHEPDVTILDLRLPDIDGLQVLEVLRQKRAMVILLTGYGDIPTAVQAMRLGAENFLTKPVEMDHLVATVERAFEKIQLRRENVALRALVPTSGKRLRQLLAAVVLIIGAWALGWFLGGDNARGPEMPRYAPITPAVQGPSQQSRRVDSLVNTPAPAPIGDSALRRAGMRGGARADTTRSRRP